MAKPVSKATEEVFRLFRTYGNHDYLGEKVTQLEHAIQCAMAAERENSSVETVLGALLHDIGHLVGLDQKQERMVTDGVYLGVQRHDLRGEAFLIDLGVPTAVARFSKGHVDAKRYLTFKTPEYYQGCKAMTSKPQPESHDQKPMTRNPRPEFYEVNVVARAWDCPAILFSSFVGFAELSDASKMTLVHQGGPMTQEEAVEFEKDPCFQDLIRMRNWDEQAKVEGMAIKSINEYQRMFEEYLSQHLLVK